MLLDQANPYRPQLPQMLHLDWEDFDSHLSAANDKPIGQEREWSVVAYMAANCNLAEYMFDDLLELKSIASNAAMHVCVLFAGPLITDTFFARLNPGGKLSDDIVFRFTGINSSDPRTLTMALRCANIFPARRRLAFLSGHGQGWKGVLLNENLGRNYADDPERLKSPGPRAICQARIFASLERTQDSINARVEKLPQTPHGPPDILAFDACYMGNLEVVTTLAAEARIFVVMEGRAPGEGLPYAKILTELQNNPAQPTEDLARYILKANGEKYEGRDLALRQTALSTGGLIPLAQAFVTLTEQLDLSNEGVFSSVQAAMENAAALGATGNIDFKELITELLNQPLSASARQAAQAVLEQFIRLDLSSGSDFPASGSAALSIYAPLATDFDTSYLQQSPSLSPLRGWVRFLGNYYTKILGDKSSNHALVQSIKTAMDQFLAGENAQPSRLE
jgi:Clostripain family